jgi:hypothetical protein
LIKKSFPFIFLVVHKIKKIDLQGLAKEVIRRYQSLLIQLQKKRNPKGARLDADEVATATVVV